MPATRTESRQGSRPATHYGQPSVDVRPAEPTAIAVSSDDDGSPPRKKLAVEKKSAPQRSKQKARAPLPPPSEIIEISSDDDDEAPPAKRPSTSTSALERRVKELEVENKRWREIALAAEAVTQTQASIPAKPATPPPDTRFDKLLSTMDEHVSCEICTMKMWNPYTLACGHTFCKDCLQDWFSTALAQHMATNPAYNPQGNVPPHWRAALTRPDLSIAARRHIEREIALLIEATPQPTYSCPTCRVEVRARPAENFVVKHIVRTIAGLQGESCPKQDPLPRIGHPVDGPWDGFFPSTGR
ncbi:hypothetical protein OH77DRAFT_1401399 [Trametes cingulata]|nr:hypothetical protein OH77DRAFT_1401399 [Trametes cingulata]